MAFRIVVYLLVAAIFATGGLIFGMRYAQENAAKEAAYAAGLDDRPRVVAVSNLDEGVDANGENKQYSTAIIETLGSGFAVTGYPMAKQGLADGAYDAVIVFPADFSRKVSSVSAVNPQKIMIDYQMGERLSEKAYIETFTMIEDFQAALGATLGYMYVVSLYNELHAAQDEGAQLLSNNEKTLKAIDSVDTYNFTRTLNLGDMPQIRLEFQPLDFEPFVNRVNGYAQEMSDVYLDSYADAKNAYQSVVSQLATEIQEAQNAGTAHVTAVSTWEAEARAWLGHASTYEGALNAWKAGAEGWHTGTAAELRRYGTEAGLLITEIENARAKIETAGNAAYDAADKIVNGSNASIYRNYEVALLSYQSALDSYAALLSADAAILGTSITAPRNAPEFDDDAQRRTARNAYRTRTITPNITELRNILNNQPAVGSNASDPLIPSIDLTNNLQTMLSGISGISKYGDKVPSMDQSAAFPSAASISLADFNDKLDTVKQTAFSHDPLAYLTDADKKKAEGIIGNYASEVGLTKSELVKSQADSFEKVSGAYTEYTKHVGDLRAAVYAAYEDELKRVDEAKGLFVKTGRETSAENRTLISDFVSKLPNSRNGQSVNQTVAEFIAAPVALTHVDIRSGAGRIQTRYGDDWILWIILCLCLAALVIAIAVRTVVLSGKKKGRESEATWALT